MADHVGPTRLPENTEVCKWGIWDPLWPVRNVRVNARQARQGWAWWAELEAKTKGSKGIKKGNPGNRLESFLLINSAGAST